MSESLYLDAFGAAYMDPADHTRCSQEVIAAGRHVVDPQINGVCTHIKNLALLHDRDRRLRALLDGLDRFRIDLGQVGLMAHAAQPKGRDVIRATTKHPRETCELLRWLTVERTWQHWQMRALLLNGLWTEYCAVLARWLRRCGTRSRRPPLGHAGRPRRLPAYSYSGSTARPCRSAAWANRPPL